MIISQFKEIPIVVKIDRPFGTVRIRPVCEIAKGFAKLLGQDSFTEQNIEDLKTMGFMVITPIEQSKTL